MFQSLIVDAGEETDIRSWEAGNYWGDGTTWPDYYWDHHQETNYFADPQKDVPGQQQTFNEEKQSFAG